MQNVLPAVSGFELSVIRDIERRTLETQPQVNLPVIHSLHAGVYSRTVMLPADRYMTGAEMKIPTTVVIFGDCLVNLAGEFVRVTGHATLCGAPGRKQLFVAVVDTYVTMFFATFAKTVAEAEAEFTDQAGELNSRMPGATNEVAACQE